MTQSTISPPVDTWSGWVWPVVALPNGSRPVVSDGFKQVAVAGVSRQHLGVDIMFRRAENGEAKAPEYSKGFFVENGKGVVVAAGPGTIYSVERADKHGMSVKIDHGKIAGVGPRVTAYRHLASVAVEKGQIVNAGSIIGIIGYDLSQGAKGLNHLHFEIWDTSRPRASGQDIRDAYAVNPEPMLKLWRVKTPTGLTSPIPPAIGDVHEDAGEARGSSGESAAQAFSVAVDLGLGVPGGIL